MSTRELSEKFDTLVSSYSSIYKNVPTGLLEFDEYEKSIFLTNAQKTSSWKYIMEEAIQGCLLKKQKKPGDTWRH